MFLHAYAAGGGSGKKVYDVHFWQGRDTSVDEAGASALWAVQLDLLLDDMATQYRETEGHESKQFLQMFEDGVRYVDGGVESGFRKNENKPFQPTLLQVKGKRTVIIRNVPVSISSLNSGDVFILDAGNCVYQWNGSKSSSIEKSKGLSIAISVRDQDRGGRPPLKILDEGETNEEYKEFMSRMEYYSGESGDIQDAEAGGCDEDPALRKEAPKLFAITVSNGRVQIGDMLEQPLTKEMLDTSKVFALCSQGSVYVWIGRQSPKEVKEFVQLHTHAVPDSLGIERYRGLVIVKEGLEEAIFRANFSSWSKLAMPKAPPSPQANAQTNSPVTFDVSSMQRKSLDRPPILRNEDDEREVKIWRVENLELVEVDRKNQGHFFCGDCYIVLCEPTKKSKTPVIYYWQGRDATQDERGASAMHAVKLDNGYGGSATLVRVSQGKEPPHFCSLFQGKLVIHLGGVPSGFRQVFKEDPQAKEEVVSDADESSAKLFQVKGTSERNVRAVEVAPSASNLNSGDCFILVAGDQMLEWYGKHSNLFEKAALGPLAESISEFLGAEHSPVQVKEGAEDETFWSLLGGEAQYPDYNSSPPCESPRLFRISNDITGPSGIVVEEIYSFTQEDLVDEDVMLLDVYTEIFLWVGRKSNRLEREEAMNIARKYIDLCSSTDGRSTDTPIAIVHSGRETNLFTHHFLGWDPDMPKKREFVDPYEEKLRKLKLEQEQPRSPPWSKERVLSSVRDSQLSGYSSPGEHDSVTPTSTAGGNAGAEVSEPPKSPGSHTIPYHVLRTLKSSKDGIDMTRREAYLSHEEFHEVFGMSRPEFHALKSWRQVQLKKKVGLF